jgi:thymidylate kinase
VKNIRITVEGDLGAGKTNLALFLTEVLVRLGASVDLVPEPNDLDSRNHLRAAAWDYTIQNIGGKLTLSEHTIVLAVKEPS